MADSPQINVPKLRRAVLAFIEATPRMTRRKLSLAASEGRNPDVVRDLFRVDKRMPLFDTVAGLAKAMGQDIAEFVADVPTASPNDERWLTVCGAVAAGVWTEHKEWARDDWFQIEVTGTDPEQGETGLIVEGRSMDRTLPPGTFLRCIQVIGSNLNWQDGDYVIVERVRGGLRELTCKLLSRREDGNWELRPESNQPEFQEAIFIGRPTEAEGWDGLDDETRVSAIVVDAFLPLRRRKRRFLQ